MWENPAEKPKICKKKGPVPPNLHYALSKNYMNCPQGKMLNQSAPFTRISIPDSTLATCHKTARPDHLKKSIWAGKQINKEICGFSCTLLWTNLQAFVRRPAFVLPLIYLIGYYYSQPPLAYVTYTLAFIPLPACIYYTISLIQYVCQGASLT